MLIEATGDSTLLNNVLNKRATANGFKGCHKSYGLFALKCNEDHFKVSY